MSGQYAQQAFLLRLPEHLEEIIRARLRAGNMDGVQLTARPDGSEGLRKCDDGGGPTAIVRYRAPGSCNVLS